MNFTKLPENSTVLIRVDYNISNFDELFRISTTKELIETVLDKGNKVILCTHFGRPKGVDLKYSTTNLVKQVETAIGLKPEFVNQFNSFEEANSTITNSTKLLFILENTRFEAAETSLIENEKKDLAKSYSKLATFFIDEAFSVSHRQESTNYYIKDYLPWEYGINYNEEIKNLSKLKNPKKPFIVVMGGAKVDTKLGVIQKLLPTVEKLLLGGMICFTFLRAKEMIDGLNLSLEDSALKDSFIDEEYLPVATELLIAYKDKIVLPIDFVYNYLDGKTVIGDIGSLSAKLFCNELEGAKTVFFNGTLGEVENPSFAHSTTTLVIKLISLEDCLVMAGGGDTESFLTSEEKAKFDFVSTGGGACLEYLSKN